MILFLLLLAALPTARTEDNCPCLTENSAAKCSDFALEEIPTCLPPNITSLDLKDNAILTITNKSFELYPNLTQLHLGGNNISEANLDTSAFKLIKKLTILSIENNRIRSIERGFLRYSSYLEELQVSNNEIEVLDKDTFYSNTELQELYLNYNMIKELPEIIFLRLKNLKVLNLNNNRLTQLHENLFAHNVNLTQLFLSHNHISTLPATIFYKLPNMKTFRIADNNLSFFHEKTISRNPDLRTLDVSNNELRRLYPNTFVNNTDIKYLVLENNPWVCDCFLALAFENSNFKDTSPCSAYPLIYLCHEAVIVVSWQMTTVFATERCYWFVVLLTVLFCCLYAAILIFIYGGCFDKCRYRRNPPETRMHRHEEIMPPSPSLFQENSSISQYVPRDLGEEGPLLQERQQLPTTNGELQLQPMANWRTRPLLRN